SPASLSLRVFRTQLHVDPPTLGTGAGLAGGPPDAFQGAHRAHQPRPVFSGTVQTRTRSVAAPSFLPLGAIGGGSWAVLVRADAGHTGGHTHNGAGASGQAAPGKAQDHPAGAALHRTGCRRHTPDAVPEGVGHDVY